MQHEVHFIFYFFYFTTCIAVLVEEMGGAAMVARQMREKQEASQNEVNHGPSTTFKVRKHKGNKSRFKIF